MNHKYNSYTFFISLNIQQGSTKEEAQQKWQVLNEEEKKKYRDFAQKANQQNVIGKEKEEVKKEITEDGQKNDGKNSIRGVFTESKEHQRKTVKEIREIKSEEIKNRREGLIDEIPFIVDLSSISYFLQSESNDSLCDKIK